MGDAKTKNAERVTIELMKKYGINISLGEMYSVRCQYAQIENVVRDLLEGNAELKKKQTVIQVVSLDTLEGKDNSYLVLHPGVVMELAKRHDNLVDERADLKAKIDALMFEHCPDEMTKEQIAEYEKNQEVANVRYTTKQWRHK